MAISSAERTGHFYKNQTLSGGSTQDETDIFDEANFESRSTFIVNDSGADITVTPTPAAGVLTVKHNEVMPLYGNIRSLTMNGAGSTVRIFAYERSGMKAPLSLLLVAPTAASVGVAELKDGSASEGVESGKVRFSAAETAGGAFALSPAVPVHLQLTVPNMADGDADWTGLIGKHQIVDAWVQITAGGDNANTYIVETAGGVAITDAMTPGATNDSLARAELIVDATATIADGGGIRVAVVKTGGSSAAVVHLMLVPVA